MLSPHRIHIEVESGVANAVRMDVGRILPAVKGGFCPK